MTHLESISLAMDAIFSGKPLREVAKVHTHECTACGQNLFRDEVFLQTEPNDGMDPRVTDDEVDFLVSECCGAEVEELSHE